MTETQVAPTLPEQQTEPQGRQEITIPQGNLGNNFFGIETPKEETPATPAQQQEAAKPEVKPTDVKPENAKPEQQQQIQEWWKDYGWENPDLAKAEIEELKKLKEQPKPDFKFENEESRKVVELLKEGKVKDVLKIYETQERIDAVLSAEVTKDTAADIIKMGMKLKYPGLSDKQIDFQYTQDFGVPKEPVMKETEDEAEFKERYDTWKEQVANIEMKATIAATMAKPEIEKAKTQIVLPDISQQQVQKPPTQEELEAAKLYDAAYIKSVESSLKDFNGFSVTIKNEDVGLPETSIPYLVMDNEKAAIAAELKDFVKTGYDVNSLFAQRWVNEDKTLNTKLMAEDRYWLQNKDKIVQKIANDSAIKAIENYIKGKKNINVTETSQPGTTQFNKDDKTELDLVRDQFFG